MFKKLVIVKYGQRGMTAVELMVALSILLIALALGFNFFIFGVRAYGTGEQRTIVQNNVRLASSVITEELRFADQVEIHAVVPSHQNGKRTIYLTEDGLVVIRDELGNERPASGQLSNDVVFTDLAFSVSTESHKILFFSIGAEREGMQSYQLESEVAPLNQIPAIVDNTSGAAGISVTYTAMKAYEMPNLSIIPKLMAPGENVQQVFELSLINDKFISLNAADIDLSGEAFSDLLNSDIEIISYSEKTAEIRITGNFNEGFGSVTVKAAALERNYDLSADVAVIPDYLFIADDFVKGGFVGIAYTHTLSVTGGTEPYEFYMVDSVLPSGLSLDTGSGTISGVPLEAVSDHAIAIGVTDADGETHVREYLMDIEIRQYNLSIASVGPGTTEPSLGNYLYDYGEVVTIKAIPSSGHLFLGWDGEVAAPKNAETTVTMTADITVIANISNMVLVPLNEILGGYYLKNESGEVYIKLTGNSYRVLQYKAGNIARGFNGFDEGKMPSMPELEGGVWDNHIRKEPSTPTTKPYWTNTVGDTGSSRYYAVDSSGSLVQILHNTNLYLREISTFTGYYVEEKAGTYADPHILVDPADLWP